MPLMTPTGTANTAPSAVTISVPAIALAMPPPGSPTGVGMCVKKSSVSDCTPRVTAKNRMKPSGSSANSTAVPQSAVITKETPARTRGLLMRVAPAAASRRSPARAPATLPADPPDQQRATRR